MTSLKYCFCGSMNGTCKLKNSLIVCNTYSNAKLGDIINGYRCIKVKPASFQMVREVSR